MLTDDYDTAFSQALLWDDRRPMPFERARTQLAYGRRLHRARWRADARDQLRATLEGFDRLGATPWATQACDELRAAGGRLRTTPAGDPAALTGQEVRVAATAARGGSTPDIAVQLFLAPEDRRVPPGPDLPQARRAHSGPGDRHARGGGNRAAGGPGRRRLGRDCADGYRAHPLFRAEVKDCGYS
jgi:hypothetical protein